MLKGKEVNFELLEATMMALFIGLNSFENRLADASRAQQLATQSLHVVRCTSHFRTRSKFEFDRSDSNLFKKQQFMNF